MSSSSTSGAMSAAVLAKVVSSAGAAISVAAAGSREAFLDAWMSTLSAHASHLRSEGKKLGAPVVVAYVPDSGEFGKAHQWKSRPMLGTRSQDQIAGVVAAGTSQSGGLVYPGKCNSTEEAEEALRSAGLQKAPTLALVSETRLLVWPEGIDGELKPPFERDLLESGLLINLTVIDQELARFYKVVARQRTKWWLDAKQRVCINQLETSVQDDLWLFLAGKYSDVARVKQEERIGNGRADLTIVPVDTSGGNESAVLELKTIRDVRTPQDGNNPSAIPFKEKTEWAVKGLKQTASYRDGNMMSGAFLCLYDFCASDGAEVMKTVDPAAEELGVAARRYWITASHDEHIADKYVLSTDEAKA